MNLYLVERTDYIGYDEYAASIIIAKNTKQAKELFPGYYAGKLKVKKVGVTHYKTVGTILNDFRAA